MEINPKRQLPSLYTPESSPSLGQEKAKKIYYQLGERFWMQIIDGKYHKYGSMVFD